MKTLIIVSHPSFESSRVNKALFNAVKTLPDVNIRHIEAIYGTDTGAIDAVKEAAHIAAAERIVLQFPLYWLATPPMMKAYIDAVFSYCHQQGRALEGKELQIVVSTGSQAAEYSKHGSNKFTLPEVLVPLNIAANYCGMIFNKIFVVYGALDGLDDATLAGFCERYVKLLKNELENEELDH